MRYTSRRRRLSDPEIVSLYSELQDSDLVAARAGCSGMTVLSIVRRAGMPVQPPGGRTGQRRPNALSDDEIVRLYRAGLSAIEIGERAGCSTSTVYRILRMHNVERRNTRFHR